MPRYKIVFYTSDEERAADSPLSRRTAEDLEDLSQEIEDFMNSYEIGGPGIPKIIIEIERIERID